MPKILPALLVLLSLALAGCSPERPAASPLARPVPEPAPEPASEPIVREMAVTVDDLPVGSVVWRDLETHRRITRDLVAALGRHEVPAVGFVNESKLAPEGAVEPARVELLRAWLAAGLELGNHTYSHPDLHRTDLADFQADVLRGERVTRALVREHGGELRYFRHPFLHTGRDLDTRRALEAFLAEHGYRVAPVTVDNDEYIFAAAYDRATARGASEARGRIAAEYLDYMERVVAYFEEQSIALFGRNVRHVLLLHANALNADTFDALAGRLRERGYSFLSLDAALEDPAYRSADEYTGPMGLTWLHRWALTRGESESVFAGPPEVPEWVRRAAEVG